MATTRTPAKRGAPARRFTRQSTASTSRRFARQNVASSRRRAQPSRRPAIRGGGARSGLRRPSRRQPQQPAAVRIGMETLGMMRLVANRAGQATGGKSRLAVLAGLGAGAAAITRRKRRSADVDAAPPAPTPATAAAPTGADAVSDAPADGEGAR